MTKRKKYKTLVDAKAERDELRGIPIRKMSEYQGKEWLRAMRKDIILSPLGEDVADAMGEIWKGLYHLPPWAIHKGTWGDARCVSMNVRDDLSTYDFDILTRLVFIAHDRCLRLQVCPSGPGMLKLMWHRRKREGGISESHPTIEKALAKWREIYPV